MNAIWRGGLAMELVMMKAKNVAVGVKNGMTRADFCEKYQCNSDEFDERMEQLYSHNKKQLKDYFAKIEANEKKARKEIDPAEKEESPETVEDAIIGETVSTVESESAPEGKSRSVELKYLAELEEQQSQRVMDLESEHKALATEHRSLKNSLRKLSKDIDDLMSKFQSNHQKFEEILSRNEVVEARMNEITKEWGVERTALEDTRSRIEELSVVTLCVYDSGEIAPMDGYETELDDSGWESTREALLAKDECQELRLKDITTLAKLLAIVEHADCKIEAMCDNAELEMAFRMLRSE